MLEVGNGCKTRCRLVVKDVFILYLPWFLLVYMKMPMVRKLFRARVMDAWSTANTKDGHPQKWLEEAPKSGGKKHPKVVTRSTQKWLQEAPESCRKKHQKVTASQRDRCFSGPNGERESSKGQIGTLADSMHCFWCYFFSFNLLHLFVLPPFLCEHLCNANLFLFFELIQISNLPLKLY
jgi:hypothetical protein